MQLSHAVLNVPIVCIDTKLLKVLIHELEHELITRIPSNAIQFLEGGLLKLPHFAKPLHVSNKQSIVIKFAWGDVSKPPPIVSWKDCRKKVVTGYRSFDELFYSPENREQVFDCVGFGKYRLRRV